MSPALSHVEQSRNTLLFATSAKEVTNSARVNMVVEKKRLVKQLQEEVARLEAELRSPEPSASLCLRSLLKEKDLKIQKMEREINELKRQRDLAESHLELERSAHKEKKASDHHGPSCQAVKRLSFTTDNDSPSSKCDSKAKARKKGRKTASTGVLVNEIRKLEMRQRQLGEEANRALELLHKEVASQRFGGQDTAEAISKMLSEIKGMNCTPVKIQPKDTPVTLREELARLNSQEGDISVLEEKLENVQKSIENLVKNFPTGEETPELKNSSKKKKGIPFTLSNTANMQNLIRFPCSTTSSSHKLMEDEIENRAPQRNNIVLTGSKQKLTPDNEEKSSRSSRESVSAQKGHSSSVSLKKMKKMFKKATEDHIQSIKDYVTELKERVAKLQYQKQLLVCQVLELEEANEAETVDRSPMQRNMMFEDQRREIILLWHVCHVSIIHRTQFYLLFRGDPSDQIYMEVELRRLRCSEQHLDDIGNASPHYWAMTLLARYRQASGHLNKKGSIYQRG